MANCRRPILEIHSEMYLAEVMVAADERIVERFKGGFVRRFGEETTCIDELYRYLIRRQIRTEETTKRGRKSFCVDKGGGLW